MSFAETLICVAIVAIAAGVVGWATSPPKDDRQKPWRHDQ